MELCTACIEKWRLEKETIKHKNGNFWGFNLVSKLPIDLIKVEALGRPFTITEAFQLYKESLDNTFRYRRDGSHKISVRKVP